ncbi:threonine dehydratase [Marinitenerispora sediminis]|uniref:L-threonine dehydratase n=1 Tax=Marinitenerispora sediminis TaxID=1931232 RepID=A0A368TBS0_9ACTN|nr:threonine dehydratase [Marinitenerispora sediminis]RCV57985.1 threonine dehydratase [Marinitenerispora sediminis]RCV62599.1 threonine dehydratase [Marinitenerispora sediminis]
MTAADVAAAADRFTGVIPPTPLQRNERLSARHGLDVWLKREDLNAVRSYKGRGALNFVRSLDAGQRRQGVICASAGNHAQGVAFACASLGIRARVYLPRTTPRQKRDRVAHLGGESVRIVVTGETYDDAAAAARADAEDLGMTLLPAFDDPRTIAGQGTVVKEAVEQLGRAPDAVVVPVGGGGLLAGTLAWLREEHPEVRVVGAEPLGAPSMAAALEAGHPVQLEHIDPFVDGAAVRRVGRFTHAIAAAGRPRMVVVPEGRICGEILDLYQSDGIISEPAGALASAALGPDLDLPSGATVLCVLSGGNNDVSRYAEIVERALVHEGRKHYFLIDFPQEPGALRRFLDEVLGPDDDITRFEYVKRNNRETGPALVGVELGAPENLAPILKRMDDAPHRVERIFPDSPLFGFLV